MRIWIYEERPNNQAELVYFRGRVSMDEASAWVRVVRGSAVEQLVFVVKDDTPTVWCRPQYRVGIS